MIFFKKLLSERVIDNTDLVIIEIDSTYNVNIYKGYIEKSVLFLDIRESHFQIVDLSELVNIEIDELEFATVSMFDADEISDESNENIANYAKKLRIIREILSTYNIDQCKVVIDNSEKKLNLLKDNLIEQFNKDSGTEFLDKIFQPEIISPFNLVINDIAFEINPDQFKQNIFTIPVRIFSNTLKLQIITGNSNFIDQIEIERLPAQLSLVLSPYSIFYISVDDKTIKTNTPYCERNQ